MKKRALFIFLILIFLLTSCQSLFVAEEIPSWAAKRPKNTKKWVYFYGHGEGSNPQLAKNKGNIEVLEEIEAFIGADGSETYYRELSDTSQIKLFGMELYREANVPLMEGGHAYYVLYKADRTLLEQSFSEEYKEILQTEQKISELLSSALEDYKENNDVESISKLLNALSLSLTFPVKNEAYKSDVLLNKVIKQLSELKIKIRRVKPETGEAEVKLIRTYGLFHPPVKNANVSARFTTYEPLSGTVGSSLLYKTDDRGRLQFKPVNPYMVKEGSVTFYLDIKSELYNLSLVAPEDYMARINEVIANIQASFDYSIASKDEDASFGIVLNEFDADGRLLDSTFAQDAFKAFYEEQGIKISPLVSSNEEELALALEDIKSRYPEIRYLIWGRVGVVDTRQLGEDSAYSITGDIYLIDMKENVTLKEEKLAAVASWDEDKAVALEEGYKKYGRLVAVKFIFQY